MQVLFSVFLTSFFFSVLFLYFRRENQKKIHRMLELIVHHPNVGTFELSLVLCFPNVNASLFYDAWEKFRRVSNLDELNYVYLNVSSRRKDVVWLEKMRRDDLIYPLFIKGDVNKRKKSKLRSSEHREFEEDFIEFLKPLFSSKPYRRKSPPSDVIISEEVDSFRSELDLLDDADSFRDIFGSDLEED